MLVTGRHERQKTPLTSTRKTPQQRSNSREQQDRPSGSSGRLHGCPCHGCHREGGSAGTACSGAAAGTGRPAGTGPEADRTGSGPAGSRLGDGRSSREKHVNKQTRFGNAVVTLCIQCDHATNAVTTGSSRRHQPIRCYIPSSTVHTAMSQESANAKGLVAGCGGRPP